MNEKSGNMLCGIPETLPEELEQSLLSSEHVTIKRILSKGQCSPNDFWYDQPENEWVLVLQGEGILEFSNDEDLHLKQGAYCFIPAHKKHRVKWTAENQTTIWLAIYFSGQEEGDDFKKGAAK